ncbi:MAG TPA: lactate permease LctP family transporter [Hyphomicrobiales bacterium]|nr:lactate permease LctP family transporter [Hyphomicrobiales bacterium]
MWEQNYLPVADNLALSALLAAIPIFVLLTMIGIFRKPAWVAAVSGLVTAFIVAIAVYGMPLKLAISATGYGAAQGLFPIGWIVYWAIVLYRITLDTGKFEIIKDSIGGLTADRRLQAMLIAFAFGAFIEGAAGFGTPVAVAAAMLAGLGFSPFFAAGICLLANTAPVAFGSIGIPVVTLASITGLSELELSSWVGRLCAPISVFIPAYLILVMGGRAALKGVIPAAVVCGVWFASVQFLVSNFIGPQLTDILAAISAILGLVLLFKVWQPSDNFVMAGDTQATLVMHTHPAKETLLAWSPYILLVLFVLVWGSPWGKAILDSANVVIEWPGLHNQVIQGAPVVAEAAPYAARFTFNWLSAAGTACALASTAAALLLGMSPKGFVKLLWAVLVQMAFPLFTIAAVLALALLMNYSGSIVTMGMAFAATGALFPFFSALLGWLGVFLTGSDTSANALFGNLQVVTATQLGLDPAMMAAANSAGGVMGKMISLQSLAVAVAATNMARSQEGELLRFTFKHSVFLACVLGCLSMLYAYL